LFEFNRIRYKYNTNKNRNNFDLIRINKLFDLECEQLVGSHLLSEIGNTIAESDIYENRTVILPYLLEACEEGLILLIKY